ncbi:MAG: LLM class F420-dependent oxidoreductase [Acidimicrobiales bacterium]
MRIGIFGGEVARTGDLEATIAAAARAHDDGLASFWLPQIFGGDALTTLAIIGREVTGIELGTAVVPTYPRHPLMLAAQALTVQQAAGDRLALGIGLSHQVVIESIYGMSYAKPVGHMKDYLSILRPLLHGEPVAYTGEHLSANGSISVPDAAPPPILVAALGTQMLRLTGRHAEGTVTWMTGPTTLAEHIVPTINSAAREAGRGAPRIVAALPVCVTDDPEGARALVAKELAIYGELPSYRAMLDRERAAGPADVSIVGDEATVAAGIAKMEAAGVTDFVAVETARSDEHRQATRSLLTSLR